MEGHAATVIVLPLDLANHLALIKRATSRISPASHRGRKIVARCAGGDPLWQGVAQGRIRYERFWAVLATVGGEAVFWGSASGVLAITRGPESKMSAAGAQSDSTRHPKYNFRLPASFGNWRRPPRGTRCERAGVRFPCATHVVILCRR